jgi:hypothetical protein
MNRIKQQTLPTTTPITMPVMELELLLVNAEFASDGVGA